tara:strand:- start:2275 stop:2850 length:576 start_codon:yes stop_codon:yes gene_type:complete
MFYVLQNTPTTPVSLSVAKAHLRVDFNKDDTLIQSLIEAAVGWGESYTNMDFSVKEWVASFASPCFTNYETRPYLELKKSPINAVTSLTISSNGTPVASTGFIRKQRPSYDRLLLTEAVVIDDSVAYTYDVSFTSGFTDLPSTHVNAILEHVAFLYENRGDVAADSNLMGMTVPKQIKMLYNSKRNFSGYA